MIKLLQGKDFHHSYSEVIVEGLEVVGDDCGMPDWIPANNTLCIEIIHFKSFVKDSQR